MGNQPPVVNRGNGPFRSRPNGTLGLSRSELDERCKPSGLYQSCEWDERTIRRLIGDGKLAARQTGQDCRQSGTEQECPICFLYYDEINMLKCCKATICTECYLQLQNPRERNTPCPFCNKPNMSVDIAKRLNLSDVAKRDEEEQRVIEATIRARSNSESQSLGSDGSSAHTENFGTRLNEELKRSRRLSSADLDADQNLNINDVAMTVDERRELEDKMKSQLSHPLMREMQRNAQIESQRHMLEHAERRRDQVRNSRDSLERFIERARIREHGFNLFSGAMRHDEDGRPSMDDLYLLEAALFLSAREDSMRRRRNNDGGSRSGRRQRSRDSALLHALMSGRRGGRDVEELLNAARRNEDSNSDDRNNNGDDEDDNNDGERNDRVGLSPSDFMLVGLSEDSQIEMAIQMSLREAEQQQQQQQQQQEEEEEEEEEENQEENGATDVGANNENQNSVSEDGDNISEAQDNDVVEDSNNEVVPDEVGINETTIEDPNTNDEETTEDPNNHNDTVEVQNSDMIADQSDNDTTADEAQPNEPFNESTNDVENDSEVVHTTVERAQAAES